MTPTCAEKTLMIRLVAPAVLACLAPAFAQADISVTFIEGAPKDRFVIANTGTCDLPAGVLQIDVSDAVGGLIFDVTGDGAGVEVFQPFELASGGAVLTALPQVVDGDQRIDLPLGPFPAQAEISFTIDMDDTAGTRGITVNGSELAGAVVRRGEVSAPFDASARAILPTDACRS